MYFIYYTLKKDDNLKCIDKQNKWNGYSRFMSPMLWSQSCIQIMNLYSEITVSSYIDCHSPSSGNSLKGIRF